MYVRLSLRTVEIDSDAVYVHERGPFNRRAVMETEVAAGPVKTRDVLPLN